jgi:hypothetical protein
VLQENGFLKSKSYMDINLNFEGKLKNLISYLKGAEKKQKKNKELTSKNIHRSIDAYDLSNLPFEITILAN